MIAETAYRHGARAGFINREFDQQCLDALIADPEALQHYSVHELVSLAGAQGVEILNWMAARGTMAGSTRQAYRNYHIPISNTAAAVQVLGPLRQ